MQNYSNNSNAVLTARICASEWFILGNIVSKINKRIGRATTMLVIDMEIRYIDYPQKELSLISN